MSAQELAELSSLGGATTIEPDLEQPFLQFAPDLPLADLREASIGRELFVANWTPAPGPRETLDGLGPLAIVASCVACHPSSGQAPTLREDRQIGPGILLRLAQRTPDGTWQADPVYGHQLQTLGLSSVPSEGRITWQAQDLAGGRQTISYTIEDPGYGPLPENTSWGARRAPGLLGMGLLDTVHDNTIREWADPEDLDGDGISGRVHDVLDIETGTMRPGRFGWKALHSTLKQQSAAAFSGDMGLTSTFFPEAHCQPKQESCLLAPSGGDIEVSDRAMEGVVHFLSVLGVPARRITDEQTFARGRLLFHQTQCASCHRPSMTTSPESSPELLAGQTFWPYTDLLLHDMGEALADIPEGNASPSEWRTPPLWSLDSIARQPGGRFLHDGRARTLDEAIRWHGGEAKKSRNDYLSLSEEERDTLIAFLLSI